MHQHNLLLFNLFILVSLALLKVTTEMLNAISVLNCFKGAVGMVIICRNRNAVQLHKLIQSSRCFIWHF